jgi:hypothetical protein
LNECREIFDTRAREQLSVAARAFLTVTAGHVQFSFDHATIVTGMFVSTLFVRLSVVSETRESLPIDHQVPHCLSHLDAFGPALDHVDATILNE